MTKITITPAMHEIVDYFTELGPRWGLAPEVTQIHALLYLIGGRVEISEICRALEMNEPVAQSAISELIGWRSITQNENGVSCVSDEPWDLLFSAFEERQRREVGPSLKAFNNAMKIARNDGTSHKMVMRISALTTLVKDVDTLGKQMGKFSSRSLSRFTRTGSRLTKLFGGLGNGH